MTEYTIPYARFLLRSWGFTKKVPMGRYVKRASRQKIAWFRKRLEPLIEERKRASYTVCVQDEAIYVADARLRKGVYTLKGIRGVYAYTGSHSKTIVFGLITIDGEGFFQRYGFFTGKEFVEFLKAACERFGKVRMIAYGAPQHRSKFVREEIGRLDGMKLRFLPSGCPNLNAIEEVWRQMKHMILDVPYVRFSSMCSVVNDLLIQSLLDRLKWQTTAHKYVIGHHQAMKWDLPKGDQFLPDTSIDELKALHRAEKDTKARDRLLVYMARKRGDAIRKIADDFGSTYSTIRDWLVRAKGGLDRLHDAKRSGPPRRLDAAQLAGIREDLLAGPRKLGFETDMWTGKILVEHVRRKHGMAFVPRTMQTLMREMGFRNVKPRPRHPKAASDEEKKAFKKKLASLPRTTPTGATRS